MPQYSSPFTLHSLLLLFTQFLSSFQSGNFKNPTMKFKSLLALFCVVLGLFIWLRFFEKSFHSTADTHLLQIDPSKVTDIIITDGNNSFSFKQQENGWNVSTTPPDHADDEQVNLLLMLASTLKPFDLLHFKELKNNHSLSALGLQNPRRSITFHQEGVPDQIIYFGNEAVGEKSIFAKVNNKRSVVIIPSALADQAFRPHDDFRDHLLTTLQLNQLRTIQLHQELGNLSLVFVEDHWRMEQPTESNVNDRALKDWITPLLQAPIIARVRADDGDLAQYGLDQPRAEITLFQQLNQLPIHLWLGNVSTEKDAFTMPTIYVRSSARKAVFKVSAALEKVFMIPPDLLRDHQLFSVNLDGIDKITITKKDVTISLRHQLGGGDAWVTEGSSTSFILGSDVQRFVDKLEKIDVLSFEAATPKLLKDLGLDPPSDAIASIRFTAHLSENTPDHDAGDYVVSEVLFGTPINAPGSKLYARVNNTSDLRQVSLDALTKFDLSIFLKK